MHVVRFSVNHFYLVNVFTYYSSTLLIAIMSPSKTRIPDFRRGGDLFGLNSYR